MLDANVLQSLSDDLRMSQQGALGHAPLYHQLYLVLKTAIRNGTIPPGSLLPGEQQLAAKFDISRITVKRALDELASEKLVSRSRGKGTRTTESIAPRPVRAPLVDMLENLIEMGKNSSVRVVSVTRVVPPADVRALLGLQENEKAHRVVRVRSNQAGEPFAYYVSYTTGISRGFTRKNLESTPRLDVLRQNGIQLTKVEQMLSAENASARIAADLDTRAGSALLSVRRRSYDQEGRIVDVLDCLYHPQRFQYLMVLTLD